METGLSSATPLARTARAWHVLPHPQALDRQARALLLLANGRRSLREISCLLGCNVEPLAEQLRQKGLLRTATPEQAGEH